MRLLGENIYILLHRSDLNIPAKYVHFFYFKSNFQKIGFFSNVCHFAKCCEKFLKCSKPNEIIIIHFIIAFASLVVSAAGSAKLPKGRGSKISSSIKNPPDCHCLLDGGMCRRRPRTPEAMNLKMSWKDTD